MSIIVLVICLVEMPLKQWLCETASFWGADGIVIGHGPQGM